MPVSYTHLVRIVAMQHTVYRFHHVIFAACIAVKATHIPVAKHTVCLRIRNRNDHGADVGAVSYTHLSNAWGLLYVAAITDYLL